MAEYEKKDLGKQREPDQIEEIDPDYITGGAAVVPPEVTEGLMPRPHTEECNCGEFSPNESGKCGAHICENCKHGKKMSNDSDIVYCPKQFMIIS